MRTNENLDPEQKAAIRRIISESNAAVFGDLGTGKTIISLYAIKRLIQLGHIPNALVVTTRLVMYGTWRQEAKEWQYTRNLQFNILHGPEKNGRLNNRAHIHIINYDGLLWLAEKIRNHINRGGQFPYGMAVFDESTKLKSWKTKRFKAWKLLLPHFKRRYILTATPQPNHALDLWAQFYLLDLGKTLGTAVTKFQMTYFENVASYIWRPKKGAEEIIKNMIAPKVIRIVDKEGRPEPRYNRIRIELPEEVMVMYRELEREYFLKLESGEIEVFNAVSAAIKLRQFVQGAIYSGEGDDRVIHPVHQYKLDALEELIELAEDQPILCPIQFRFELNMIKKRFPKLKIPVVAGGIKPADAEKVIVEWNRGMHKLVLCHPLSMSHGLNLQAGGHLICWFGLTWSLEQYDQLIGRLNRRGQKRRVIVHHILANNTIDDAVMSAIEHKAKSQKSLLAELHNYWTTRSQP
jgi:SNF2 family DNA or RNA helicase